MSSEPETRLQVGNLAIDWATLDYTALMYDCRGLAAVQQGFSPGTPDGTAER